MAKKYANTDMALIHDSIGSHPNNVKNTIAAYAKGMYVLSQTDFFDKMLSGLETEHRVPKINTATADDCRSIMNSKHILC